MTRSALALVLTLAMPSLAQDPVEAHQKAIVKSLAHWALFARADSPDPAMYDHAVELGKLRVRAEPPLDEQGVNALQKDFDDWKDKLSDWLYQKSDLRFSADGQPALMSPEDFRVDLEKGVSGLADIAESKTPEARTARTSEKLQMLQNLVGRETGEWYEKSSRGEGASGVLATGRAAGSDWESKIFVGFAGKPRDLSLDRSVVPGPAVSQVDQKIIDYAKAHWGIQKVYGTMVVKAARAMGIDPMLAISMMNQESSGDPKAVSPAGARGLMQLMPGTARSMGVRKIFDPKQNIQGGVKYIRSVTDTLAARGYRGAEYVMAGYNAGPYAVIKKHGVPRYRETRAYVQKIKRNIAELVNAGSYS